MTPESAAFLARLAVATAGFSRPTIYRVLCSFVKTLEDRLKAKHPEEWAEVKHWRQLVFEDDGGAPA